MRADVLALPQQLREAAGMPVAAVAERPVMLFAGMGGSGMAGRIGSLVAAAYGAAGVVHAGYGLPGWAASLRPSVIAVSYSGETEETLSAVHESLRLGLDVATVTGGGELKRLAAERGLPTVDVPGGMQPRAALGYQAGAVMRLLEGAGIIPDSSAMLGDAADAVAARLDADAGTAAAISEELQGRFPVIYGSDGSAALAAMRWQTQINENAKGPALAGEIPEMNHNQLEGWTLDSPAVAPAFVLLSTNDDGDRVARRHDLTAEILARSGPIAGRVRASGSSVFAEVFTLIAVGDLVSVELAAATGVDPEPVDTLESFKARLLEAPS